MAQQYITILRDGKGNMSTHKSFKMACSDNGWEYDIFKERIPKDHEGYSVTKHPIGTTIPCLILLEFIIRKGVKTSVTEEHHGYYSVDVEARDDSYTIRFKFERKHSPAIEIQTDRGLEVEQEEYYYTELTSVISIFKHEEDGAEEIKFDRYTEKHLLNLISID